MNNPTRNTIAQMQTEPKGLTGHPGFLRVIRKELDRQEGLGLDGQNLYSLGACSVLPAVVTRVGVGSVSVSASLPV